MFGINVDDCAGTVRCGIAGLEPVCSHCAGVCLCMDFDQARACMIDSLNANHEGRKMIMCNVVRVGAGKNFFFFFFNLTHIEQPTPPRFVSLALLSPALLYCAVLYSFSFRPFLAPSLFHTHTRLHFTLHTLHFTLASFLLHLSPKDSSLGLHLPV